MSKIKLLPLAVILLVFGVFTSGCASMRASSARNAYIHNATRDHVYQTDCNQVWAVARQMLFQEGYEVKNTGEAGMMTLETEWKFRQNQSPVRYLVQGVQPAEGQCQVVFTMNTRASGNQQPQTGRDLDMEWLLLQQADPSAAAQISQEAEVRGQRAADG